MNLNIEYERQTPAAVLTALDDESLVLLTHLYLELRLAPRAAFRAAQADIAAGQCATTGAAR